MRILMLIHRIMDSSAYCVYVHEQAKALRALGHEVTVVSPVGIMPFQKRLRPAAWAFAKKTPKETVADGIPVRYPRYLTLGNTGERYWGGRLMVLGAWPVVRREHERKPFDVVHAHMLPQEGHAGEIMARRLGIPCVITVHGTDVIRNFPMPGEGKPLARNARVAREADALMAVSGMLARRVEPYRERPVDIVLNGVDLSLVPQEAEKKPRLIISVGMLKKRKCIAETLEAFNALKDDYPDATLTIIGIGEMEEELRARVAQLKLEKRVCLTGGIPHAQVMRWMAQSDVMCLPSYGEGYGIVYIEAMACGAVAIGGKGEGIEDTIREGVNGLLVPAGDVKAIEAALRRVFDAPDGMWPLRRQAMRDARALTWEANAAHTAQIYARVIKEKKRSVKE